MALTWLTTIHIRHSSFHLSRMVLLSSMSRIGNDYKRFSPPFLLHIYKYRRQGWLRLQKVIAAFLRREYRARPQIFFYTTMVHSVPVDWAIDGFKNSLDVSDCERLADFSMATYILIPIPPCSVSRSSHPLDSEARLPFLGRFRVVCPTLDGCSAIGSPRYRTPVTVELAFEPVLIRVTFV